MSTKPTKNGVSIIVLLYNPDAIKLKRTINSIINQKDVDFEVILSDDGSVENPKTIVDDVFGSYNFTNYSFHRNEKNIGTVKNILSVLDSAKYKYVYLISPGDLIYDETTMSNFVNFSNKHQAKVCFGDYICYNTDKEKINIIESLQCPSKPSIFDVENYNFFNAKVFALLSGNVLGPAFFREREYAIKYITLISQTAKYVEDNTATMFSLAENIPLYHNPRNICWYESGSGISTPGNKKWEIMINKDYNDTFLLALKMYPKDRIIKAAYFKKFGKHHENQIFSLFFTLLRHPIIFFTRLKQNKIPNVDITCTPSQTNILDDLLSDTMNP